MSHQGLPGWFPECINCGGGNLGPVVCLVPHQEDQHEPLVLRDEWVDELVEDHGHWFKPCQLCAVTIVADPFAFGSYALCIPCWNHFVEQGLVPPTSPRDLRTLGRDGERGLRRWRS